MESRISNGADKASQRDIQLAEGFFRAVEEQKQQNSRVDRICGATGVDEDELYELIHEEAYSRFDEIRPRGAGRGWHIDPDTYMETYREVISGLERKSTDELQAAIALRALRW